MADPQIGGGEAPLEPASAGRPGHLVPSGSFKSRRKASSAAARGAEFDDLMSLMHGSDPVKVELNRLENEVREKERELGESLAEIKALKYSERLKEKAVEELTDELNKVDSKLKATEALLENKNLELKKVNDEKKAALAAQFAAEASLRRVHAAQKDDEMPPIEAIIAPLEAELKLARLEAARLQDDNRALDRLTKSKEAALVEADRTIQMALAKASLVDDLQNKNQELMKQIEICQEENKILDKLHRQKVAEVEKLSQTVRELEEAVLAGGAAANAVRDYQRKMHEINEEKKILDRQLARAKVTANRVAVVVANEWKDANDKVMPVKQWLEERRFLQGEMQQLRDKLAIAERTSKSEAQLKERYQLRLKVIEDALRSSPSSTGWAPGGNGSNGSARRQSLGVADSMSRLPAGSLVSKRTSALRSGSPTSVSMVLKHAKGSSRSLDSGSRSLDRNAVYLHGLRRDDMQGKRADVSKDGETATCNESSDQKANENCKEESEDFVSGLLYDILQKEVIALKKGCHEKDQSLKDKDDAIEMLAKKVDTLSKAMEVEGKKMRREVSTMEKEIVALRAEKEQAIKAQRLNASKGPTNGPHAPMARASRNS